MALAPKPISPPEPTSAPAVLAEKPIAGETSCVEEKEDRKVTFEVEGDSELEVESPVEELHADPFTDEKTGTQYLKDEEGRLYDKDTREEMGLFYGGRVMLDSDLEAELGLTED